MKCNYMITFDGIYSSITVTEKGADEYKVFKNFGDAKKTLLEYLKKRENEFKAAYSNIRSVKLSSLTLQP